MTTFLNELSYFELQNINGGTQPSKSELAHDISDILGTGIGLIVCGGKVACAYVEAGYEKVKSWF